MQTPNNAAGRLTEAMMEIFKAYTTTLSVQEYNNIYSKVYRTLYEEVGDAE